MITESETLEKIRSLEPYVEFDEFSGFFNTTFKRKNVSGTSEKSDQKIIELISQNPEITIDELMQKLVFSASGVKKIIKNLEESGRVKRVGPDKGGHWEVVENN